MRIAMIYPEIYRKFCTELAPKRLGFALLTIQMACFLLSISMGIGQPSFLTALWSFTIALLGLYGSGRLAHAISEERRDGTWDFLRLTPLSATRIVIGKLIAAPLVVLILFASLVPWIVGAIIYQDVSLGANFFVFYGRSLACIFGIWSLTIFTSAYQASKGTLRNPSNFIAWVGTLVFYFSILATKWLDNSETTIEFFGMSFIRANFVAVSFAVFGIWALYGTICRVGTELLQPARAWRLAGFFAFLALYAWGLGWGDDGRLNWGFYLVVGLAYAAALWHSDSGDDWRRWIQKSRGIQRWHLTPKWIQAAGALLVVAIFYTIAQPTETAPYFKVSAALFVTRDLVFLAWCRLRAKERGSVVAAICIGFAYILLPMVASSFVGEGKLFLFLPSYADKLGVVGSIVPALVHVAIASVLLGVALRREIERAPSPELPPANLT